MDNTIPFQTPLRAHDAQVVALRCHDRVQLDTAALARTFAERPRDETEDMLCRILENIVEWLDVLQQALGGDCFAAMEKPARRIALVGGQIGLTEVAIAAGHLGYCARIGDRHALAAIIGRLERAFDLAVTEVWDFRDP